MIKTIHKRSYLLSFGLMLSFALLISGCSRAALAQTKVPLKGNERGNVSYGSAFLNTRPAGAYVSVDGVSEGTTPIHVTLCAGKHLAILTKPGKVPSVDTLEILPNTTITVDDSLFPVPVTSIASNPEGASVFVDSVFVGRTPLDSLLIPVGYHHFSLRMPGYRERNVSFFLEPGFNQTMSTQLVPDYGFISVKVSPPDTRVSVDGGYPVTDDWGPTGIPLGWHTMVASHPGYQDTKVMRFYVTPGCYEKFKAGLNSFSPDAALYSAVIPGLGQILDGSYLKGSVEMAAMSGALYFLFDSMTHRVSRQSDFIRADAAYESASTESQAVIARANLTIAATNLTSARNAVTAGFIAAGAVYVLTLADALIFNSASHEIVMTSNSQLDNREIMQLNKAQSVNMGIGFRF